MAAGGAGTICGMANDPSRLRHLLSPAE
jgi:hypothetical protein